MLIDITDNIEIESIKGIQIINIKDTSEYEIIYNMLSSLIDRNDLDLIYFSIITDNNVFEVFNHKNSDREIIMNDNRFFIPNSKNLTDFIYVCIDTILRDTDMKFKNELIKEIYVSHYI